MSDAAIKEICGTIVIIVWLVLIFWPGRDD